MQDDSQNWKDWDLSRLSNSYGRGNYRAKPATFIIEQRGSIHTRFANDPQFMASLRNTYRTSLAEKLVRDHMLLRKLNDFETEVMLRIMVLTPVQFYEVVEAEVDRHLNHNRWLDSKIKP
jgi:hypothetical protein